MILSSRVLRFFLISLVATSIHIPVVTAAVVSISDEVFNDSDWNSFIAFDSAPLLPQILSSIQVSTGGNPGSFRQMQHSHGSSSALSVFYYRKEALYNPSVNGAIQSIEYSADVIGLGGCCNFADGFILAQDGSWFWADSSYTIFGPNTGGWQNTSTADLTANDFQRLGGGTIKPDFSSSGSPIWFGYFRNTTVPFIFSGTTHGIDNWKVQIAVVPIPSALVFFISAILSVIGIGFKRRCSSVQFTTAID